MPKTWAIIVLMRLDFLFIKTRLQPVYKFRGNSLPPLGEGLQAAPFGITLLLDIPCQPNPHAAKENF